MVVMAPTGILPREATGAQHLEILTRVGPTAAVIATPPTMSALPHPEYRCPPGGRRFSDPFDFARRGALATDGGAELGLGPRDVPAEIDAHRPPLPSRRTMRTSALRIGLDTDPELPDTRCVRGNIRAAGIRGSAGARCRSYHSR